MHIRIHPNAHLHSCTVVLRSQSPSPAAAAAAFTPLRSFTPARKHDSTAHLVVVDYRRIGAISVDTRIRVHSAAANRCVPDAVGCEGPCKPPATRGCNRKDTLGHSSRTDVHQKQSHTQKHLRGGDTTRELRTLHPPPALIITRRSIPRGPRHRHFSRDTPSCRTQSLSNWEICDSSRRDPGIREWILLPSLFQTPGALRSCPCWARDTARMSARCLCCACPSCCVRPSV